MKVKLGFILRYFIFWLAYFFFLKLVFLLYNIKLSGEFLTIWPNVFYHGLRLDLSAIGYLLILPVFLLIVSIFIKGRWFKIAITSYSFLLIAIFSVLASVDLPLYKEWGFRLDTTPLIYLNNTKGAFSSLKWYENLIYILIGVSIVILFIYFFKRIVLFKEDKTQNYKPLQAIIFLSIFASLIIPIRGGFGTAPVNTGSVYFHKDSFINHAALNLPWNIIYSITKLKDNINPFLFYKDKDFSDFIEIYKTKDTISEQVISSKRPNIILIILESFTSKVVGVQNSDYKATPYLDSLAAKGILFNEFYASGFRSDKGLVSILSGYPAQPNTSVMVFPEKTQKLPGLAATLNKEGYSSTFYYGGDINFASMKSYLLNAGFQNIVSQTDFSADKIKSSWGVPDEYLFNKVYNDIIKADTPYFKTLFTLSSHPPYDVPGEPFFKGNSEEIRFLNSIYYCDQQMGLFLTKLEKEGYLKNTLVILVADHGSKMTGTNEYNSKENYKIPMVWYGGPIKGHTVVNSISSQIDIPATLLAQMHLSQENYVFSRNIFDKNYKPEAYYAFRNGFGYYSDSAYYMYVKESDKIYPVHNKITPDAEFRGKLFYQALHENFILLGH